MAQLRGPLAQKTEGFVCFAGLMPSKAWFCQWVPLKSHKSRALLAPK
jgi:hypothetical protein